MALVDREFRTFTVSREDFLAAAGRAAAAKQALLEWEAGQRRAAERRAAAKAKAAKDRQRAVGCGCPVLRPNRSVSVLVAGRRACTHQRHKAFRARVQERTWPRRGPG